jgi:hypothetical protein
MFITFILGHLFAQDKTVNLDNIYPRRGYFPVSAAKVKGFIPYQFIAEEARIYDKANAAWTPVHLGGQPFVELEVCGVQRKLSSYHYLDPTIQTNFKLDKINANSNLALVDLSDRHTQSNYRWDSPALFSILQDAEMTTPLGDVPRTGQNVRIRRVFIEFSYLIAYNVAKKRMTTPQESCKVLLKIQNSRCNQPIHQFLVVSWAPESPSKLVVEAVSRYKLLH